jgi:hypothetical protein
MQPMEVESQAEIRTLWADCAVDSLVVSLSISTFGFSIIRGPYHLSVWATLPLP